MSYIVILKNKSIQMFPHITQKPLCLHMNPIQSLLIHTDVTSKYLYTFVYVYMYHNFLSLYSMFISLLIQFLKLSILIFGFEWRYPKLSTFSIHFIPNCHPLLEITDIPVNVWHHNRKVMMTQMKSDCWMMSYKPSRFLNRQQVYCVI